MKDEEVATRHASRRRRFAFVRPRAVSIALASVAAIVWSGIVSPTLAEETAPGAPPSAAALATITEELLQRAATGGVQSEPEPSSRVGELEEIPTVAASVPDPRPPASSIPPAQPGISVVTPPGVRLPKQIPSAQSAAGYQSNSARQARPEA